MKELSRDKKVLDLSMEEMAGYGCNILCLKAQNHDKHRVVMSKLAYESLSK